MACKTGKKKKSHNKMTKGKSKMIKPTVNELTWKQFVVTCCRLGVTNSSDEIARAISRNAGITVTPGQVAAVKANYKMGRYNN